MARDTSSRNNTLIVREDSPTARLLPRLWQIAIRQMRRELPLPRLTGSTVTISSRQESGTTRRPCPSPLPTATSSRRFLHFIPRPSRRLRPHLQHNTYEFCQEGGAAKESNIAIELDDPAKATPRSWTTRFANGAEERHRHRTPTARSLSGASRPRKRTIPIRGHTGRINLVLQCDTAGQLQPAEREA